MLACRPLFRARGARSCSRRILCAALLSTATIAATAGTAQAAPPSCSSAQNYATMVTHNETAYMGIAFGRGFVIDRGSFSDTCVQQPSQNRTYVEVVHAGTNYYGYGDPEHFRLKVYVYPFFNVCENEPPTSLDLGNVTYVYARSDGAVQQGVYSTPCE